MKTRTTTAAANTELTDELTPEFIFSMTATQLLVDAAAGKFNLMELARYELANRGLDQKGRWVGFTRAKENAKCVQVRNPAGNLVLVSIPENE